MTFRVWSNKEINSAREAKDFYENILGNLTDIARFYNAIGLPMKISHDDGMGSIWDKTTKLVKVTFNFTDNPTGIRAKKYFEGLGYPVDSYK